AAGHIVVTRGGAPSQPDTTRCGCGGCHAVRPPPRGGARRRTTLSHHLGLRHHSPTPQGAAVVAVPSSDRHHDGGEGVGYGDGLHGIGGGRLRWCGSEVVLRWWCMRRCGRSDEDGGEDGVKIFAGKDGGSPEKSAGKVFPAAAADRLRLAGGSRPEIGERGERVFELCWEWVSNSVHSTNGCRIMIGWDKDKVDVMVVHMTRQVMLVVIKIIKLKQKVFCSFVYASNSGIERRSMWNELRRFKAITSGCPWIFMGDFSVTLNLEEHFGGGSKVNSDMQDFGDCVNDIEVGDVNCTLLFCTWIKSPSKLETSILKKLDRVMVNSDFIDHYGNANARFLPFLISDHSSVVLHIPNTLEKKKNSFRFSNFVADKEEFIDVVKSEWKNELKKAQVEVEANPNCKVIKEKLSNVLQEYNEAIIDEEKLLAQKSKVKWLSEGDRNTNWDIIGGDVCGAVKEFFKSNKLLGEVNATLITLIPKIHQPNKVSDYRPIACCNVIYKSISKIITKRIQGCLEKLVNMNQSAFVPGRLIQDNLLITQELLKGYNRKIRLKRCALKIDIAKAYDTVNWDFLKQILIHFGFHEKIIGWIMTCVTSAAFTVCVNGESVKENEKQKILEVMPFAVGTLPMKYLGVPLITKNIGVSECRLQLIAFVLASMHIYWASVFLIPKTTVNDIEKALKGFLWCHGDLKRGAAKVAWKVVCAPKSQGGLGIKRLGPWNEALLCKYLWNVIINKDSLWVKWVNTVKLKDKSIWEFAIEDFDSGTWKAMLNLRSMIRNSVWNVWFDKWCNEGPLCEIIPFRKRYEARLDESYNVADMIVNEEWAWPNEWKAQFRWISDIKVPILEEGVNDCIIWKDNSGKSMKFSIRSVWEKFK
ncbi:RNA-directed DNA polymerase, eukaryota, reverse transcriptase zinc-binding domain protein, partial [Tanacetum coccineum]